MTHTVKRLALEAINTLAAANPGALLILAAPVVALLAAVALVVTA